MTDEKLYTLREVAEYAQVSMSTIYRWIAEKKLKAFKPGGQWRVRESDLPGKQRDSEQQET